VVELRHQTADGRRIGVLETQHTSRGGPRRSRRIVARLLAVATASALILGLGSASAYGATGDWTQFRESQAHQARNSTETLLTDTNAHALAVAWTGATGGAVNSSPAVANGVVYVGSSDGKLYAFAVGCATGGGTCSPIWTGTTGGAIDSSPAISNGKVYVGSSDGKLYAFAAGCSTGGGSCSPLWTASTGAPIHSSPAIDGGVIYIGSESQKLYAFGASGTAGCSGTPKTCSPIWTGSTSGAVESSPAVSSGVVYVGSNDGKLYAFATGCATGGAGCVPLWTATTGAGVHSSPAVFGGVVYVGSLDGILYAYDAAGVTDCSGGPKVCTPIWTGTTGGAIYSSPSVGAGAIWVGSDDGKVYSFHTGCNTGGGACTPLWTSDTGAPVRSSPAETLDVAVVGSSNGTLYAYEGDCQDTQGAVCAPLFSHSIGSNIQSSAAISNSFVYVGSSDGKLYAFTIVADHLVLSPSGPTINAGATQAFTAEAFDASNVDLGDVTALTTFTITPPATCTVNSCGATVGGDFTVTGTYRAATGQTTLHVSSTGSTYFTMPPTRLLDSRSGNGLSGVFMAHVPRSVQVTGRGGVPTDAIAITGNLTVTGQSAKGYLFAGPTQMANPLASTLNFPLGDTRANAVTVALGVDGTLSITYVASSLAAHTHVILDVTGYFVPDATGATFFTLDPTRLLDTRSGLGIGAPGVITSHVARSFPVAGHGGVPSNAIAVTGNLTVTGQSTKGYLFLGPDQDNNPTSSTLNFPVGDNRANAVTVKLNTVDGSLWVTFVSTTAGAHTHAIFDVTGYFLPGMTGATFVALNPTRILDTRFGTGLSGVFVSHHARSFGVATHGGVPSNAVAVTGNLTVTNQTVKGLLYCGPDPLDNPTSSTLNFPFGDNRANAVTVKLNTVDGSLAVTFVSSNLTAHTDVLFDVSGYFVPAS
jgi:outer membrane protein assembly factor BamB